MGTPEEAARAIDLFFDSDVESFRGRLREISPRFVWQNHEGVRIVEIYEGMLRCPSHAVQTVTGKESPCAALQGSLTGAVSASGRSTADFADLASRLAALQPLAITQLGLLTLLATPVARVAASVLGYAQEGDRLYTSITLAVLAILLTSIFLLR
jgi:hypothetical protein